METNANDNNILKKIHFWRPDVFIVVGWYHIVPKNGEILPSIWYACFLIAKI